MKKIYLTLIIMAMAAPVFSQVMPEVDKFKTSAGEVEIYFIGHGSLMFKVNDLVIHIDPVATYGNYNNLPKADLILVTHEHYDHLDPALVEKLKKAVPLRASGYSLFKIFRLG